VKRIYIERLAKQIGVNVKSKEYIQFGVPVLSLDVAGTKEKRNQFLHEMRMRVPAKVSIEVWRERRFAWTRWIW